MQQKLVSLLTLITIIIVIGLVASTREQGNSGDYCRLESETCTVAGTPLYRVTFSPFPAVTEHPVKINLTTSSPVIIESAWIEGVNMFMGRIPITLTSDNAVNWQSTFFVGACSEPKMQWQLIIKTRDQQSKPLFKRFIFSTQH